MKIIGVHLNRASNETNVGHVGNNRWYKRTIHHVKIALPTLA